MANPIIRIKRGSSTPANGVLSAGELAVDLTNKNLFVGQADGSALPIGGEGTFATKDYVTNVTGSLGTMSQQNADSVAITGGTIDGTTIGNRHISASGTFSGLTVTGGYIYNDQSHDFEIQHQGGGSLFLNNQDGGGSVKITASDLDLQASRIVNVGAPSDANDAVRKTDLDAVSSAVSALGSAFNYVGTVAGGADAASATDLSALAEKDAGDYYKVGTAGYFVLAPASAFYANANDGLVFNNASGVDLIDNTNSSVSGSANEIAVTGSADSGFVVAIDSVFSGRLSTAESDITDLETKTQNIDLANTTAGTTTLDGQLVVNNGITDNLRLTSTSVIGEASAGDFTIGTLAANGKVIVDSNGGASDIDLQATAVNVTGNLVGSGTSTITDFVIDGGTF